MKSANVLGGRGSTVLQRASFVGQQLDVKANMGVGHYKAPGHGVDCIIMICVD